MAPERITGKLDSHNINSCKQADMWSIGVVMYLLICGKLPFPGNICSEIFESIKKGSYNFYGARWLNVTDSAKDLVKALLQINPYERIDACDALNH